MTGNKIMVDTSILIDLMKGDRTVAKKMDTYAEVYISPIVLVELYFGAYRSASPERNLQKVSLAIDRSSLLLIDNVTAETFVAVKLGLFAKGQPIPENDIWIASSAIQHRIPLFTKDRHFIKIGGLQLA